VVGTFVRLWRCGRRSGCGVIAFLVVKSGVLVGFENGVLCDLGGKRVEVWFSELGIVILGWIMV
jgi:hypothetical protein